MCKYYGYCRVSTETQAEKGYGLEAQEKEIRKYAGAHGLQLERMFLDAGISGNLKDTDDDEAISKREALMEMLSLLEKGDTVIVLNTSRLWRSDMTKAIIRRELMKREARIISVEQPKYDLYTKDPNDYLINAIMEALDVYERMSISLKLARGRTVKAKGGDKPAGVAPFGYQYAADKKSVEINPEEAATVKMMFSEAQKGLSLHQLADFLNSFLVLQCGRARVLTRRCGGRGQPPSLLLCHRKLAREVCLRPAIDRLSERLDVAELRPNRRPCGHSAAGIPAPRKVDPKHIAWLRRLLEHLSDRNVKRHRETILPPVGRARRARRPWSVQSSADPARHVGSCAIRPTVIRSLRSCTPRPADHPAIQVLPVAILHQTKSPVSVGSRRRDGRLYPDRPYTHLGRGTAAPRTRRTRQRLPPPETPGS